MVAITIVGLLKISFPWIFPVKLIIRGEVAAILLPIDGPHTEPWVSFSVEMKIKSRVNDTIDDFYLELRPKAGQRIKIPPFILLENKL